MLKKENDDFVGVKQAPPLSFWQWGFFSVWNGLEQPESDGVKRLLKRVELLQPGAEPFYSFGGEQHLSGNLSKGALGSERRKSCELQRRLLLGNEIDAPSERQLTSSPYSVHVNNGWLDSTVRVTEIQEIYFIITWTCFWLFCIFKMTQMLLM